MLMNLMSEVLINKLRGSRREPFWMLEIFYILIWVVVHAFMFIKKYTQNFLYFMP